MNPETSSSNSSGQLGQNLRKERGAIAAQACDTCRSRKQRCDEQRPKCGLCHRMKLECNYREPQPTKKDKTLLEILNRLTTLENKIDRIPKSPPPPAGFGPAVPAHSSQTSMLTDIELTPYSTSSSRPSQQTSPGDNTGRNQPYKYASAAHKMLSWPTIQDLLYTRQEGNMEEIRILGMDGPSFIVNVQNRTPKLPQDELLEERPFLGMQSAATRATGGPRVTFPDLTRAVMQRLADAYFDSFNLLYPFMDRQNFLSDTLSKVHTEGFNGDTDSVAALLVFALGELAIEGSQGTSHDYHHGRPSGILGGTVDRPPGLALFNEARKRLGFVLTDCDLENIQIFSLAALYYASCSRHADFWRLTVSASLACQVLITCPIEWGSHRGDLVKRTYWHCAIMESGLHLDLDLPLTGIIELEAKVGLPSFNASYCDADETANQASHFRDHFRSQIDLRRICTNFHNVINECKFSISSCENLLLHHLRKGISRISRIFKFHMDMASPWVVADFCSPMLFAHSKGSVSDLQLAMMISDTPATSTDDLGGPTGSTLKVLASELEEWRRSLPAALHWPVDDPTAFPTSSSAEPLRPFNQPLDPSLPASRSLFTEDLVQTPTAWSHLYDIQVALLRTKYYYAKYMIYRPFIYKVLHFPDQITQEDAEGAATCLKSCIRWPLTLSPPSRRKRLVPYLFSWSQTFLGILLILHLTRHNDLLIRVRREFLGPGFDADAAESIRLMLDWIRDLKSSDPIASWCYNILRNIYPVDG